MKKLFFPFLSLLSFTLLLTSCVPLKVFECGPLITQASLTMSTPYDYNFYRNPVTSTFNSNVTHQIYYQTNGVNSSFSLKTTVKNVCSYNPATINSYLYEDTWWGGSVEITDSLIVKELGETSKAIKVPGSSSYLGDMTYNFKTEDEETELIVLHRCSFPWQGSAEDDSVFFFNKVYSMSLDIDCGNLEEY